MRLLSCLLLAAVLLPLTAQAASFDCRKATGEVERTICADATLSRMDSDLAVAWQQARAQSGDAQLAAQRHWLVQRDACGDNKECLRSAYRERLKAFSQPSAMAPGQFRWAQRWQREGENQSVGSQLLLGGRVPKLHFVFDAWNGANTGALEGDLYLSGDDASYRSDSGCQLDFHRDGDDLVIRQHGDSAGCGAGMGVDFGGSYHPASEQATRPPADLLALGVFDSPLQNDAAHALLGKDYQSLLDDINLSGKVQDMDQLGAEVDSYFVRGIANTNAAIVMRSQSSLWIGLLVFAPDRQLRMRYYTNVPAWKARVPATIQHWHDNNDPAIPIDRMP